MGFWYLGNYYDEITGATQAVLDYTANWGVHQLNYITGYVNIFGFGNVSVSAPAGQNVYISGDTSNLVKKPISFNVLKDDDTITGLSYTDGRILQILRTPSGTITGVTDGTFFKTILYNSGLQITGINIVYF